MTSDRTIRPTQTNASKQPGSDLAENALLSAPVRAAWLAAVEPASEDRERLRVALGLALASGNISTTAYAVDKAMTECAIPLAQRALGGFGFKLGVSTILVSGALLGALFMWRGHSAPSRQAGVETAASRAPAEAVGGTDQALQPTHAKPGAVPAPSRQSAFTATPDASAVAPAARKRVVSRTRTTAKHEPQPRVEARDEPQVTNEPAPSRPATLALAEELTLLREASAALTRHEPATALHWLAEHAVQFPRGALTKEASALRVMVLCEQHDARASGQRDAFLRGEPSSPLSERVRQACGDMP